MRTGSVVAAAIFLTAVSVGAGFADARQVTSPDGRQHAGIHSVVERVIDRQRLAGTQYAVARNGVFIAEGAFGQADLDAGVPVTPDTRFLIASVTKPMTAAVAMRLAARGAIDLDAPVQTYVPDFPAPAEGVVTPRLLINHRGGIRHYARGEPTAQVLATHYDTAKAALAAFSDAPYVSAPDAAERYSSYGYALLAAALEGATGQTFTELLVQEVFEPLDLGQTLVPDMRYPTPGRAHSYTFYSPLNGAVSDRPLRARDNDYSYNPGGGNVISTARDLVRFGNAFTGPGYLGREAWDLIVEGPLQPIPDGQFHVQDAVRYGWLVGHDRAGRRFFHATGASEAYQAGLTIFPDQGLVISALTNTWGLNSRDGGFTLLMHIDIARAVLGDSAP